MIGRTVGRFRITAKLGEGGMGSVWKAEDTLLGRSIALKFLPEALAASADARRRFLREAQAASVLTHPGIAAVHDAGESDGLVYIAMQLVEGETVSERMAHGPLPIAEAARIARAAAEALGHAHDRGVLHRDVSARNIMLDRDGRAVVVDFGLALPEGHSRITQTGAAIGTVAYMAPEVASGGDADERADIYGLGAVLFEMLTGAPPFDAQRAEAILYAAVHTPAPPPSTRRPDVPRELDRIVLKALSKQPAKRYQSARDFAQELRPFDPSAPASAEERPRAADDEAATVPMVPSKRSRFRRRRILRARILLPVALIILAIVGLVAIQSRKHHPAPSGEPSQALASVAVLPLRNASEQPGESNYLSDGICEALVTRLTELPTLRVTPWITSQRYADTSKLRDIAKELGVRSLVVGTFRKLSDSLQVSLALVEGSTGFQRWADHFEAPVTNLFAVQRNITVEVARRLGGKLTGEEEQTLARPVSQSVEAYEYYLRGAYALQAGDKESYDIAFNLFQKALELDPNLAEAYVSSGAMLTARYYYGWGGELKDVEEAESRFRQALRLNPKSATARRGLIQAYANRSLDEECLKVGKEVAALGLEDVDNLLVRADAYQFGALFDKAVPMYQRVLELDPANEGAQAFLAIGYAGLGKCREAVTAGEAYVSRFGKSGDVLEFMGMSYQCLGDFERAKQYYEVRSDFTEARLFLAALYRQEGEADKSRAILLQATEALYKEIQAHPENAFTRTALVCGYGMLGNRELMSAEEPRLLMDNPDNGMVLAMLGWAHAAIGDNDRAVELLRGALRKGSRQQLRCFPCLENLGAEGLRKSPAYQQFVKELEETERRLRTQY